MIKEKILDKWYCVGDSFACWWQINSVTKTSSWFSRSMNPKIGSKRTPSMFFMNNFAVADLTMLLFRSLSVDLRINKSNVVDWKYGEYLCYFEQTIEVLVSGKYEHQFSTRNFRTVRSWPNCLVILTVNVRDGWSRTWFLKNTKSLNLGKIF